MLISHAQNFEDIILLRALHDVKVGFYIDIGANDPVIDSVSFAFFKKKWRGINVEPSPYYADLLRKARPDDTVLEAFVSSSPGTVRFYDVSGTGLGTGDQELAEKYADEGMGVSALDVETMTLDEVLEHKNIDDIHWLKIDVEGAETDVLESWQESSRRPWIVIVESTLPNSPNQAHEQWEPILKDKGYIFAYFDGLNRFYVHQNNRSLLQYFGPGPNIFDGKLLVGSMARPVPRAAIAQFEETIDKLQTRLERAESQVAVAHNELNRSEHEIRRMKTEFQEDLDVKQRRLRQAENELKRARIESQEELDRKQNQLEKAQNELKRTKIESQEEFDRKQNQFEKAQNELKRARIESQEEFDRKQNQFEKAQNELKRARIESQEEFDRKQNQFEKAQNELRRVELDGAQRQLRQAENELLLQESRASELQQQINDIFLSRSWRVTAPLRVFSLFLRWLFDGTMAWVTLKPNSRPRRTAEAVIQKLRQFIVRRPKLAAFTSKLLYRLPAGRNITLESTLSAPVDEPPDISIDQPSGMKATPNTEPRLRNAEVPNLSPRGRYIYAMLKQSIELEDR